MPEEMTQTCETKKGCTMTLKAEICCRIILLYAVQICHCDLFNKEADWQIAEQDS